MSPSPSLLRGRPSLITDATPSPPVAGEMRPLPAPIPTTAAEGRRRPPQPRRPPDPQPWKVFGDHFVLGTVATVFEFNFAINGRACSMLVSSVTGHLMELEFEDRFRRWHSCDPADLFHAPVR